MVSCHGLEQYIDWLMSRIVQTFCNSKGESGPLSLVKSVVAYVKTETEKHLRPIRLTSYFTTGKINVTIPDL